MAQGHQCPLTTVKKYSNHYWGPCIQPLTTREATPYNVPITPHYPITIWAHASAKTLSTQTSTFYPSLHPPTHRHSPQHNTRYHVNMTVAPCTHPQICAEELLLVALYSVPSVRFLIMLQDIPIILSVRLNRAHACTYSLMNGYTSRIRKLISYQHPLSYALSGDTRLNKSDLSSQTFASNTEISTRHNVPIQILITMTPNPHLHTRCTTLLVPLIFPPINILLLIRTQHRNSNTNDTHAQQQSTRVPPVPLIHQVPPPRPRGCVNTVTWFVQIHTTLTPRHNLLPLVGNVHSPTTNYLIHLHGGYYIEKIPCH